jgi:hypothetical protein
MNNSFEKQAGIALIIFTVLLAGTIVLHPAGGNIEHLVRVRNFTLVSHSIALLSLPFGGIGLWGITRSIGTGHFGSLLGFALAVLALIAALLAGTINGLALPIFLQQYQETTTENLAMFKLIARYGFALNHAFDYVYTCAFGLAILCWSVSILHTRKFPVWIGWLGILVFLAVGAFFLYGIRFNNLLGLRLFITSIIAWILVAGIALYRQPVPRKL